MDFFKLINEKKISYCVIHGYESLPLNYYGHDLDILINYSDLVKIKNIVFKLIQKFKLNIFRIEERQQLFEFVLYNENLETIILQFIFLLDYKGIPIFYNKDVFSVSKKYNDINIPSEIHEYTYSFFARYFWGKEIHKKYYSNFKKNINNKEVKFTLRRILLKKQYNCFYNIINNCNNNYDKILLSIRKKIIISFYIKGFFRHPLLLFKGIFRRYCFGMKNAINHKGKFIVFIGPDGSGKTTVAFVLADLLKDFYRGIKYFHFLPKNLIDAKNLEITKQKNINISNNVTFISYILSILRIMRNTIRFNLYYIKIIYFLFRQNLIIGDRYFYNYLFNPSSVNYTSSKKIVKFFYKFIPKPDYVFFIKATPEIIYKRKKELTKTEILKQLILIDDFVEKTDYAYCIYNENDPRQTAFNIAKILLKN
jgi:thymidylate kinase